jgi:hypothetical protein
MFGIVGIVEAEINPVPVIASRSYTAGAQFFAPLQTELDHRIQVTAKAPLGHT